MLTRYEVWVHRTVVQEKAIIVEASSPVEAKRKAVDMAPSQDFGGAEDDAHYEAMSAQPVKVVEGGGDEG